MGTTRHLVSELTSSWSELVEHLDLLDLSDSAKKNTIRLIRAAMWDTFDEGVVVHDCPYIGDCNEHRYWREKMITEVIGDGIN